MAPKILTDKFLDKIAKKLTRASEEFAVSGKFQLVEKDYSRSGTETLEIDPFSGEPTDLNNADITNLPNVSTAFKAELEIITEENIQHAAGGAYPVGTVMLTINSAELASLSLTPERLKSALYVLIEEPVTVSMYGKTNTTRSGKYEIQGVSPFILRDRVFQIDIFLKYAEDRL